MASGRRWAIAFSRFWRPSPSLTFSTRTSTAPSNSRSPRNRIMTKPLVYCDYNAGAPVRAEASVAMTRALALGGNPSSVHGAGRRMRALIEDAREKIAAAVGASAENVIFTSGATEALHLALASAGAASLIVSAVEHDAVFEQVSRAFKSAQIAPVDADGVIDLAALAALLAAAAKPALVAV